MISNDFKIKNKDRNTKYFKNSLSIKIIGLKKKILQKNKNIFFCKKFYQICFGLLYILSK
jgi:hypothetical protein